MVRAYRVSPAAGHEEERLRFRRAFGAGRSILLARPDAYVAFADRPGAAAHLANWLSMWFPAPGAEGAPSGALFARSSSAQSGS